MGIGTPKIRISGCPVYRIPFVYNSLVLIRNTKTLSQYNVNRKPIANGRKASVFHNYGRKIWYILAIMIKILFESAIINLVLMTAHEQGPSVNEETLIPKRHCLHEQ